MSRYAALKTIATRAIEKESTKRDRSHLESALLFRGYRSAPLVDIESRLHASHRVAGFNIGLAGSPRATATAST